MKSLWTLFALLIALSMQAQPYTVTEDGCRMFATDGSLDQSFLIERLMWVDRGSNSDQIMIFDGISALVVQDADLANYPTTDSLIEQMKVWIVECDTAGTAPGPVPLTALFANQKSIDLDGVAEYVSVPDADNLSMTDGVGNDIRFTLSAWVYVESAGTAEKLMAKASAGNNEWLFYLSSGKPTFYLYDQSAVAYIGIQYSVALAANQWHHLAVSYNASGNCGLPGFDLYQDGIKVGNTSFCNGVYVGTENTTAEVNIGYDQSGGPWTGKLDQVCIFRNVQMNTSEIKELMTIRDITQFTYYDSLVLYQEYDSPDTLGTGGIVDLSPAGNHGTMQSGEYTDLNVCVEWPYSYQLESNTSYSNLTPMQSSADTSFGGFGWDFDGATEYIVIPDDNLLSFGNGTTDSPFSISLWANMDDATKFRIFSKFKITSNDREYLLNTDGTDFLSLSLYDESAAGARITRTSDNALTSYEGQTIHIAATYDGSSTTGGIKLYINGIEITSTGSSSGSYIAMENLNHPPDIGRYQPNPDYANGIMHDVIVLNKELSAAEVLTMYNNHAPRDETTTALAGNLVGYWRGFNSTNVASGVLDQSGNNLHGTPTNMDLADFQYTYPRQIFDADTAGSVDFDGTTEYISIADSDSLSMLNAAGTGDTSFSISIWLNADDVTNFYALSKFNTSNQEFFIASGSTDRFIFRLDDQSAASGIIVESSTVITSTQGKWQNWVFTYDGSGANTGMEIYRNADSRVDFRTSFGGGYVAMENLGASLNIGLQERDGNYANGKIAHVTIMKGIELTQCQIDEIYNSYKGSVVGNRSGSPVDPRNWTFWSDDFIHYKLDQSEDLETTEGVTNISPNGSCNGTATNMTNAANKITTSFPTN